MFKEQKNERERVESKKLVALFNEQPIRRAWNKKEEKWYFCVVDVVAIFSESSNPTDYLKKLRKRDIEIGNYLGTSCPQVEMVSNLAELSTRNIAETLKSEGLEENKIPAKKGGRVARNARQELEFETGKLVINSKNFLLGDNKS
jgi:hypothetical protein